VHGQPRAGLPSSRPPDSKTISREGFLTFFQNTESRNYQDPKHPPVSSLPAPCFYSDFSIGLLGLISGGNPNVPLNNKALDGWVSLQENRLLHPLGMNSTYLYPPPGGQTKVVHGYNQAVGFPVIANGYVIGINLEAPGSGYSASAPPRVSIVGGGGKGAEASANVDAKGEPSRVS
jgi:hypothetical protein